MTRRTLLIACAMALLCSGPAAAQGFSGSGPQSPAPVPPKAANEVNVATRALLAAQRDGTYAGEAVPLRGEQAALAYQRYLDTFSRPMPGLSQGMTGQRGSSSASPSGTSR
ncbi:DUF3613 domain-containing protein [Ralstonia sp. UBA689]|uniref:DUF3613 domain-containing protein n=1 Tax=Ralstonia sp. UBA689 TaxID=1947373 RepID=UPI0025E7CC33|nr:DUF3613 domain-containing protein [Ralstonia sp. UBA689]